MLRIRDASEYLQMSEHKRYPEIPNAKPHVHYLQPRTKVPARLHDAKAHLKFVSASVLCRRHAALVPTTSPLQHEWLRWAMQQPRSSSISTLTQFLNSGISKEQYEKSLLPLDNPASRITPPSGSCQGAALPLPPSMFLKIDIRTASQHHPFVDINQVCPSVAHAVKNSLILCQSLRGSSFVEAAESYWSVNIVLLNFIARRSNCFSARTKVPIVTFLGYAQNKSSPDSSTRLRCDVLPPVPVALSLMQGYASIRGAFCMPI